MMFPMLSCLEEIVFQPDCRKSPISHRSRDLPQGFLSHVAGHKEAGGPRRQIFFREDETCFIAVNKIVKEGGAGV